MLRIICPICKKDHKEIYGTIAKEEKDDDDFDDDNIDDFIDDDIHDYADDIWNAAHSARADIFSFIVLRSKTKMYQLSLENFRKAAGYASLPDKAGY